MEARTIKRAFIGMLAAGGVLLSLIALFLLSVTAQNSDDFDRLHNTLIGVNIAGAILLFVLLVGNLIRLLRDYRENVPGARLKTRIVGMFVGLAVLPLIVVFYFAVQYINRGIDSWFDVDIEEGLGNAIEIVRAVLEVQKRDNLLATRQIAQRLATVREREFVFELSKLRRESGASEMTLFGNNAQILATSSDRAPASLPRPPIDIMDMLTTDNPFHVSLEDAESGAYEIRTAVLLTVRGRNEPVGVLQAHFPVTDRISRMASSVEASQNGYRRLEILREGLKVTFTLTLTVVLMLSLLAAIYGALVLSRRLVAPIQDLVAGTRAVAAGNFDTRLPSPSRDEIGFLINSFNDMTQRLAAARRETRLSQALVEAERANLEVILARLSTGVVAIDPDLRIRTANQASGAILNVDLENCVGDYLPDIARHEPLLDQFVAVARVHLDAGETEWREQIVLRGEVGRRVLTCACTALPGEGDQAGGYVVVFDDITGLLQAQRDAAWGEVARRLAHEIKNPLTPIQLSAERLRRKYLDTMSGDEAQILDRATHTIVQQVEAMKEMVNAFSDYARAPDMDINRFDLDKLVHEVVDLYRSQESGVKIVVTSDPTMPLLEADEGRVRQILHNLLRNALEALEQTPSPRIDVHASVAEFSGVEFAQLKVEDNGPGFDTGDISQVFDPYVTTKPKGTGLGLAVVKKLVEEHVGTILAENRKDGGAIISIRLPINEAAREAMIAKGTNRTEKRRERA
jgi:nitrogen fixation/metabolism regulation signal transduction histidine kinase